MRALWTAGLLLCSGVLVGCADLQPHASYVVADTISTKVIGRAEVVLPPGDRSATVTEHPSSLTYWPYSATIPVGAVVKEVGDDVCNRFFTGGVRNDVGVGPAYIVDVRPISVTYGFDSVSNGFMAVTPKVNVEMAVDVRRADGSIVVPERVYARREYSATGPFNPSRSIAIPILGGTIGASLATIDVHRMRLININLHQAIKDIYLEALDQMPRG